MDGGIDGRTVVVKEPVSVAWLDYAAELRHATAFLCGLRYRRLKAATPRVTWFDRLFAWAGFVEEKEAWIRAHEERTQIYLEGMFLYADHARALEEMARMILERGGAVR